MGPRTIALGARLGDRLMLTVGAEPERIQWAVGQARHAREAANLDPTALPIGAYVNVGCHPDREVACRLVRGSIAIFAHFASLGGQDLVGMGVHERDVVARLGRAYDEAHHGLGSAPHATILDDDFVERFAVVGPAEVCAQRLGDLIDLGLDRIVFVPGSRDADLTLVEDTNALFAREVAPSLRSH